MSNYDHESKDLKDQEDKPLNATTKELKEIIDAHQSKLKYMRENREAMRAAHRTIIIPRLNLQRVKELIDESDADLTGKLGENLINSITTCYGFSGDVEQYLILAISQGALPNPRDLEKLQKNEAINTFLNQSKVLEKSKLFSKSGSGKKEEGKSEAEDSQKPASTERSIPDSGADQNNSPRKNRP